MLIYSNYNIKIKKIQKQKIPQNGKFLNFYGAPVATNFEQRVAANIAWWFYENAGFSFVDSTSPVITDMKQDYAY